MLRLLTSIVILVIALTIVSLIATSLWAISLELTKLIATIAIIFGIALALMGVITKQSKAKIRESLGRREFYGVLVVALGWTQLWIVNLSGRIDSLTTRIDQLIMMMPK